jgi:hypothetical protein
VAIPALVRGPQLRTETGMWGQCVRRAIAVENGPRGLSGGMFIGNPFRRSRPLLQHLLVTDDDALAVARPSPFQQFWGMREHLNQPSRLWTVHPLPRLRAHRPRGCGRLTSSGASGDSSAILAAMLAAHTRAQC